MGARAIPLGEVVDALFGHLDGGNAAVVNDVRLPRTALGLLVGVALGLAGALMQALTRNPLADPGLLGVNAGAAAAVVTAIGLLGITEPEGYVWFALPRRRASRRCSSTRSAAAGRGGATPVRLALAGTAITSALIAFVYALALTDPLLLQKYNQWSVGSLGGPRHDGARRWRCRSSCSGRSSPSFARPPAQRARARRRRRPARSAPTRAARASRARSRSRCWRARRPPPPGRSPSSA